MTPAALDKAALALPGAELSIKWGDDRCYVVGGKMFAAADGAAASLSLKVSDIAFEALTETGRAKPAPYAARFKWVQFDDLAALDDAEVVDLLARAHALIAGKLPKKQRAALGLAD
ncbi:MmcQ/YjbR family DNA-binding protein [Phenylobacterium sp.]|jgi:predicted DNA-binding protein (MmcQ/YjbR family)|uniref:MmcQ/YjbR family DNA-binding protein n=1 Tax=Phenylobacterium sp. TaxID=1871053 RepID=UPI0011F9AD8C|nr:MmcQ/YjbR family DNA-binding protein [Phenylobacterium sp.]THD65493.1 MAG: MmcQ/YjbR family DNA-binding protein [Phenylobacterium sp.]